MKKQNTGFGVFYYLEKYLVQIFKDKRGVNRIFVQFLVC